MDDEYSAEDIKNFVSVLDIESSKEISYEEFKMIFAQWFAYQRSFHGVNGSIHLGESFFQIQSPFSSSAMVDTGACKDIVCLIISNIPRNCG